MSEVSSAQCPVQQECKAAPPPVEHSTSAVVKYTEESAPMRLGDAVQYFGLRVAMVFLVSDGAYNAKEREAVAIGKDRQSSLIKKKSHSSLATILFVAGSRVWPHKTNNKRVLRW